MTGDSFPKPGLVASCCLCHGPSAAQPNCWHLALAFLCGGVRGSPHGGLFELTLLVFQEKCEIRRVRCGRGSLHASLP